MPATTHSGYAPLDMPWARQKALAALSRAIRRRDRHFTRAGGGRAKVARLMWARSRHDPALREDLVKSACLLIQPDRDQRCPGSSSAL